VDFIAGKKQQVSRQKDFFFESDFSPQAVRSVHPETRKLLFQGIDFYKIDPLTLRFSVKQDMADLIISSKQFADLYGPWLLALYPQNNKRMQPILINMETGYWTNDMHTAFAQQAPLQHMFDAMKHFYGKDLTKIAF